MLNMLIFRRIITLVLAIVFVIFGFSIIIKNQKVVKAFGPLKVTYPSEPMFADTDFFPGKSISRSIIIQNTDNVAHTIGINTDNLTTFQTPTFADIIDIAITRDGMPIYGTDSATGKKNLANFFAEDVVNLNKLLPGENSVFDIILQMEEAAGDEYQEQTVRFDLLTGIDSMRFTTISTVLQRPVFRTFPTFAPFPTFGPF